MHKSGGSETVPFGSLSASATTGVLSYGSVVMPCALGRRGKRWRKHEGDGASPCGTWPMRYAYYRADRLRRPRTGLQLMPLQQNTGWCDASGDRHYNHPVTHPYPASAERLWRDDGLYDVVGLQRCASFSEPRQRDISACRSSRLSANRGLYRLGPT
jgi:L,D-peptidoglycan transpeptidase YkuD (ErfK/YbiS/YcfS/YnhG family)